MNEWKNKMNIHQIIFSPTGGTRRVSEILCHGMGVESVVTDLCVKSDDIQMPNIHEDDLAVIAMPVYAGRVPALAVERLRMVKPNSAKCVVVAVFGNRAYDDALLEMQDVASEIGFRVIAAVAAVAGHSIIRKYGKGRRGCNRCGVCAKQCPADAIPLSDPKTVDAAKCISCMKCVSVCPTGARSIGVVMNFLATQGLKKVCATRKENELYI